LRDLSSMCYVQTTMTLRENEMLEKPSKCAEFAAQMNAECETAWSTSILTGERRWASNRWSFVDISVKEKSSRT
jgi:hypothetical protein